MSRQKVPCSPPRGVAHGRGTPRLGYYTSSARMQAWQQAVPHQQTGRPSIHAGAGTRPGREGAPRGDTPLGCVSPKMTTLAGVGVGCQPWLRSRLLPIQAARAPAPPLLTSRRRSGTPRATCVAVFGCITAAACPGKLRQSHGRTYDSEGSLRRAFCVLRPMGLVRCTSRRASALVIAEGRQVGAALRRSGALARLHSWPSSSFTASSALVPRESPAPTRRPGSLGSRSSLANRSPPPPGLPTAGRRPQPPLTLASTAKGHPLTVGREAEVGRFAPDRSTADGRRGLSPLRATLRAAPREHETSRRRRTAWETSVSR